MVFGDGDGEVFGRFTASALGDRPRAHPRRHPVHRGPRVPEPAGRAERVRLGRLRRTRRAVLEEADGHRGELADRRGSVHPGRPGQGAALDDRTPVPPTTTTCSARIRSRTHMDDYVNTRADNGGVHYNSGIPNRAFAVAADRTRRLRLGPRRAGLVRHPDRRHVVAKSRFAGFASATVRAAAKRFGAGSDQELAVRKGWETVGITPAESAGSGRRPRRSRRRRSGQEGEVTPTEVCGCAGRYRPSRIWPTAGSGAQSRGEGEHVPQRWVRGHGRGLGGRGRPATRSSALGAAGRVAALGRAAKACQRQRRRPVRLSFPGRPALGDDGGDRTRGPWRELADKVKEDGRRLPPGEVQLSAIA